LDLELVYGTTLPHDKSSIEFIKDSSLSNSKPRKSPILKVKQLKNIFVKNVKSRVDKNGKPNNQTYQYEYTNKKNTKTTYRPKE
jgi:hypothetical protein